jgi:hypothetical protein
LQAINQALRGRSRKRLSYDNVEDQPKRPKATERFAISFIYSESIQHEARKKKKAKQIHARREQAAAAAIGDLASLGMVHCIYHGAAIPPAHGAQLKPLCQIWKWSHPSESSFPL